MRIDKEASVAGGAGPFDTEAERELAVDKEASIVGDEVLFDKDASAGL